MANYKSPTCRDCHASVEVVQAPGEQYGQVKLDDTDDHAGHPLANWALYQDARTKNWFARKITKFQPLAPDEKAVIPHYRTCPMRTHSRELIDA